MPESGLPNAADQQPADPGAPVAGVRTEDGRLVFVRGVPVETPAGARVRFEHGGQVLAGRVSIPPPLLVWCDPSVECGRFLSVAPAPAALPPATPPRPIDLLVAEEDAPDAATIAEMLALAFAERHRLADAGTYRPRRRDRDPRG